MILPPYQRRNGWKLVQCNWSPRLSNYGTCQRASYRVCPYWAQYFTGTNNQSGKIPRSTVKHFKPR